MICFHSHVDNTAIYFRHSCVSHISLWLSEKLNQYKTEILLLGTELKKMISEKLVPLASYVKSEIGDLSVTLDSDPSFVLYLSDISKVVFFHLRKTETALPCLKSQNDVKKMPS